MKTRILIATVVAGLTLGVFAPVSSKANNAQIKVTHAVRNSGSQATAGASTSNAKTSKFKIAVVAKPHVSSPSPANSNNGKYIHR
jgi:hypothetical protein